VPITIADVAARAGVSKTTVSRVINDRRDIDRATAARIRRVIDELGYVPSSQAVGLARGRTCVIALLVPSVSWPWIGQIVQGVIDVVEKAGYGLLLFTCSDRDGSLRRFAAQVSARNFDGLVVVAPDGSLDYIARLHGQGLPVVMIDDRSQQPQFPSVVTTNREGAAAAADHLLSLGRRRPLHLIGVPHFGCTRERHVGFATRFAQAGRALCADQVLGGWFRFESGREAIKHALETGLDFDSIFAHNDLSAAGALQALHSAGRRVPDDVAVIGFDDVPLCLQTDPPLTSIHQPLRELGEVAAQLMLVRLGGEELPEAPTVIPTSIVVRGSTIPAAAVDATGWPGADLISAGLQ
jgi:LacI family transcriptional regulator